MNAILRVTRTGCQWRMLPTNLPPWPTVYGYFRRWTKQGLDQIVHLLTHLQRQAMIARLSTPLGDQAGSPQCFVSAPQAFDLADTGVKLNRCLGLG